MIISPQKQISIIFYIAHSFPFSSQVATIFGRL